MKNIFGIYWLVFVLLITVSITSANDEKDENKCPHEFTIIKVNSATSVKNQGHTGTCWSFSTTSFVESELMRMGYDSLDLSEMFFARNCYLPKAEKFVRYHGNSNFGEGGQAHDVINAIKIHGFVPEEIYTGMTYDQEKHNHGEMSTILDGILNGIVKRREVSPKWEEAFTSILDVYLGEYPVEFKYKGKTYTPKTFAEESGFNPDDYIEFTSYTNYPFYEKVNLEVPDNWSNNLYYNVPLEELIEVIDYSIENGYTLVWDGDTGSDNFYRDKGYAVIPVEDTEDEPTEPEEEKIITQEMRQEAFDSYDMTDDHLMHIIGLAENQNGTKFYYTKNSWGTEGKIFDGYWYMSEPYVKLKTVAILVHKDAVPGHILNKFE